MPRSSLLSGSAFLVGLTALAPTGVAGVDFNREIRPILSENCFYCHGQDPNHRKGNLRLDLREGALKAAESGEIAIVPGKASDSSLVAHIFSTEKDEQMPPANSNRKLSTKQRELLKQWINEGAEYKPHWAFIAPVKIPPPEVPDPNWVRTPIDRFVLAKLKENGLSPSPEADRPTLIRRLSLDLTGLPPKPEDVDAFVTDTTSDATERLIERLLASPHFGERMALPWLDAARYADSNGFQQDGDTFQWMWRDWVVNAFNSDMPFSQFSIEQLAGDLLPKPTNEQLIATGFNRNHLVNGEGGAIAEEQRFNILVDRVDTTATNWLGLTMACSQCHDHKYDPITQRDYYGLMHGFNQVSESGLAGGGPGPIRVSPPFIELPTEEHKAWLAEKDAELKRVNEEGQVKIKFDLALAAWTAAVTENTKTPDDKPLPVNVTKILGIADSKRSKEQKKELENGLRSAFESKVWPKVTDKDPVSKKANDIKTSIATYKRETVPRVMVMRDDKPRDTFLLNRGDYLQPKDKVAFSTPGFLPPLPPEFPANRLGFAQWLFTPEHPLASRVQVNRLWQLFFGVGLIKTSEDFGVQSEMPIYQDLLDWLSVEFREHGWSQKHLIRLIVNSATYRQSSRVSRELVQRDPENRLLARGARFRAPSLILRDVALSASGLLNETIGGRPVYPYQPDAIWETLAITKERDFTYPASKGEDLYRRSLYTFWRRTIGPSNMFDVSNRQTCKVRLATTSTPLHALTTLNDPTWAEAARVLAVNAMAAAATPEDRLTFAFRRVLGRKPTETDLHILGKALEKQRAIYVADPDAAHKVISIGAAPTNHEFPADEQAALTSVCLAVLNLDEALTRE
ncbi:MAG: PSD1 and planctomycete cytochrome C domain-containing protein [Verrucomicrobiota bacterium]